MKVHEIMTGNPRSIGSDYTLVEAAGLMRELDVGVLPVCDDGQLAGMITDRDMVVRGIADGRNPEDARVRDVMSGGIEYVFADQEVEEAAKVMEQHEIRRLPVLDRDQRLVGIVSLGDIATSSNPAFSGIALRDISQPRPSARRRRLEQASATTAPRMPGMRRGPDRGHDGGGRRRSKSAARGSQASRTQPQRRGKRSQAAAKSGRSTGTMRARRKSSRARK